MLTGDIGGTKTNLALFTLDREQPRLLAEASYSSRHASSLEELIEVFLSQHSATVSSACFAIAGPVINAAVKTTNLPWHISEQKLRERFSLERILILNDNAATAFSLQALETSQVFELNMGKPESEGTIGVVAPGTGLGTALLVFTKGQPWPIPSEGGHADFAPKNVQEIELLRHLLGLMPHVSVERLVSGPGLATIYSWLREHRSHLEPKWLQEMFKVKDASQVISEAALAHKDPLCMESLDMFTSMLGSAASNLALTGMTTGGIYLAGGICPKILPKLKEGGFMAAFVAKGRFQELLSRIPVRVILSDKAPLVGAAHYMLWNG